MKGIIPLGITLLTTGCMYTTTDVVAYRQVTVTPTTPVVTRFVTPVTPTVVAPPVIVTPVVQPAMIDINYGPTLDVTTPAIEFY